jgi:hypothetical protein
MTAPPSFPVLAGQGWSVHKTPTWSSRVANHVSGRQVVAALYANAIYEYELTFEGLDSSGVFTGLGAKSLQSLMGLWNSVQGQFGTFLYTDPTDDSVAAQPTGQGDGTTLDFTLYRTLGGTSEPVSYVTALENVYLNGTPQASGWSLTAPNTLSFESAPGAGVEITVDMTYAYQCRFTSDQTDFENIMSGLWTVSSLKFRSVKP